MVTIFNVAGSPRVKEKSFIEHDFYTSNKDKVKKVNVQSNTKLMKLGGCIKIKLDLQKFACYDFESPGPFFTTLIVVFCLIKNNKKYFLEMSLTNMDFLESAIGNKNLCPGQNYA
jgi:hypothetical protein